MKTPKQLKRWLYKARLKPLGSRGTRWLREGWLVYEGRGRFWRIVNGYLDMSCPTGEFDRWANSTDTWATLPTSEDDFVNTVRRMSMYDREYAKMCVGAGWHGLVDEAYDLLEPHGIKVTQVKEKFGQLRIYTGIMTKEVSDELDPKIWAIEGRSMSICECCGQPAEQRTKGGWVKTICVPCEEFRCTR